MRHLFLAIFMVVGALLIVQAAATVLQDWQISRSPQWNTPSSDDALLPPAPAPMKLPPKSTSPSQGMATAARERAD